MKKNIKYIYMLLAVMMLTSVGYVQAQRAQRPYRVSDRTVSALLTRIESRTDTFKTTMNTALDHSRLNNTDAEDRVFAYITDFENSTDQLKQNFDAKKSVNRDVEDVLQRAAFIDGFINENRLGRTVTTQWNYLKTDLGTLARYYNVRFDFNSPTVGGGTTTVGGNMPYRVSDATVKGVLTRIEQNTDVYKRDMNSALDRSVLNNTRSEDAIAGYITAFENSTDSLRQKFDARRSINTDVEDVLNRAYSIDAFMRDYQFAADAERDWRTIRADLVTLSQYYNISFDFNNRQYTPAGSFDRLITGTYRLNTAQSDNVSDVVNRAAESFYRGNQQDKLRDNLSRRLQSPETIVIEKRSNDVTVASSNSPQVTFQADGTTRTEQTNNGRNVKITARTNYDGVSLTYEGDRINDFYVNFMPTDNRQLRVIRRVYLENRNETVTVASVYDKINESAQFSSINNNNGYNGNNGNIGNTGNTGTINDFLIPNGTQVTANLNNLVSTKDSQEGDRFSMEVTSPSQYNGAVIEGRVAKADNSGRVSGRANISLEFDTIRYRGQTYRFAGVINNVRALNGDDVKVNDEGTVRDSNQTTKTVTRAGIGAGIGAIIGAIVGGGSGAAIGAGVGAGAGAGSVLIGGRDDIELAQGSQFTITASSPDYRR